jgi:hypothetical protein
MSPHTKAISRLAVSTHPNDTAKKMLQFMPTIPFYAVNTLDHTYGPEQNKRARLRVRLPNEN